MKPSEMNSNHIEAEITHRCDGPVTRFVAISRAMRLVSQGADESHTANALYNVLQDLGNGEIPSGEFLAIGGLN